MKNLYIFFVLISALVFATDQEKIYFDLDQLHISKEKLILNFQGEEWEPLHISKDDGGYYCYGLYWFCRRCGHWNPIEAVEFCEKCKAHRSGW